MIAVRLPDELIKDELTMLSLNSVWDKNGTF